MTRHPPQPSHGPLDAAERALAALLPRPHGRGEPSAALDARILAAAAAAPQAQATHLHPHRSWIAPISLAASLVLAVGLAWQLRPPPGPAAQAQAADAASAESDAAAVLAIETPPAAPPVPMPVTQAGPIAAMSPPTESAPTAKASSLPVTPEQAADVAVADGAFAKPSPAPPPAPPAPVVVGEVGVAPVATPQATEPARAAAPAVAKVRTGDMGRERSEASANAATHPAAAAQRPAADATTPDTVTLADDPGEEVPPATADSPEVRDAWLRRIGELLEQGKTEEAKASLAEFKRRYPQATLPPELRKLEP